MSRRSSRWIVAVVAAVGFETLPPLGAQAFAGGAGTNTNTYTWSGDAGSGNGNWSNGANWVDGSAPSATTPVNLVFPATTCASTPTTCATVDDIAGLIVDSLSIDVAAGSAIQYSIGGTDQLTLDGGITVPAPSGTTTSRTGGPSISDNLALGAANTWAISYGLQVTGNLSGAFALTIDTVQGTNLSLEGSSNEVGAISIDGPAGVSGSAGGVVGATQDLNGAGATPGSIQVTDAALFFGNAPNGGNATVGDVTTSHALVAVAGAPIAASVTLDSTSTVSYRTLIAKPPTNNAPLLTTTGNTALAGAALSIYAACNIPLNTSFPIVSASTLTGTFSTASGQTIANGDVIAASNQLMGGGCTPPDLKITYTSSNAVPEVEATVTNAPPTYPTPPTNLPSSPTPPTTTPTPQPVVTPPPPATAGYRLADSVGDVFGYGVPSYGSLAGVTIQKPVVGIATDACTGGYWLAAADGGVFSYNAPFYGSAAGITLNKPIVGIASYTSYTSNGTPVSCGYWLAAADGGVFSYNAPFHGSAAGTTLNKPVVAITADPATGGYWLAAADGGVFSYNAPFHGSAAQGVSPSGYVVGAASA